MAAVATRHNPIVDNKFFLFFIFHYSLFTIHYSLFTSEAPSLFTIHYSLAKRLHYSLAKRLH